MTQSAKLEDKKTAGFGLGTLAVIALIAWVLLRKKAEIITPEEAPPEEAPPKVPLTKVGLVIKNYPPGGGLWQWTAGLDTYDYIGVKSDKLFPVDREIYIESPLPCYLWDLVVRPAPRPSPALFYVQSYTPVGAYYKPPLYIYEPGIYEYDCLMHSLTKVS